MSETSPTKGIDELIREMQADDRGDRLRNQTIARPIDYARARSIYPQQVYGALRTGKLQKKQCPCGSLCVSIPQADDLFGFSFVARDPDEHGTVDHEEGESTEHEADALSLSERRRSQAA